MLAWIFVVSRLAHAAVHTTSNDIGRRFGAYVVGTLALLAMWLVFAAQILFFADGVNARIIVL